MIEARLHATRWFQMSLDHDTRDVEQYMIYRFNFSRIPPAIGSDGKVSIQSFV